MKQVPLGAEVESIGKFGCILLVHEFFIALAGPVLLHFRGCKSPRASLQLGVDGGMRGFLTKFLAFFRPSDTRNCVLMNIEELLTVRRELDALTGSVLVDVGPVHGFPERGQISSFLQALDGCLASGSEIDMPPCKCPDYNADDTGNDGKADVVNWHEILDVSSVGEDLFPDPAGGAKEGV